MIIPLVDEVEWLHALRSLPAWHPPKNPMLIVAPHPDDETLGAGGLIKTQRSLGIEVVVAAVTDGENAYEGVTGLGEIRRREQAEALQRLGVSENQIVRLELTDSGVTAQAQNLMRRLLPLVSSNTHVVAPWAGDFHPDHEACGRAAEQVARQAGAKLTQYFFWTWHRGTPPLLANLPLRQFSLTAEMLRAKLDALHCHRSQLRWEGGDPILPESLLAPVRRPFEVFAVTP